eukprot:CRZ02145.1 hypothetical protein [Spongospora subterranea]
MIRRNLKLYGRDLVQIHWRRSTVGGLILNRCRIGDLVVSGVTMPMNKRQQWTNFKCKKCHYTLVAVAGRWTTVDLSTMNPNYALAVVTNVSQMRDQRPNSFHLVTEYRAAASDINGSEIYR